jgi:hypothetical protein
MNQPATAFGTAPNPEFRSRLGKLIGMLGSKHEGERQNASAALERALTDAGLSFGWLADQVAGSRDDRGEIFRELIVERLSHALRNAWVLLPHEAAFVRGVLYDLSGSDSAAIVRAIEIADRARRMAGPSARNIRR